jgi:hypothetical protein
MGDFSGGKVGFVGMEFGAGIWKMLGFRKDLRAYIVLQKVRKKFGKVRFGEAFEMLNFLNIF